MAKEYNKINKIKGSGKGPGGPEDKAEEPRSEEPCSLHIGEGSGTPPHSLREDNGLNLGAEASLQSQWKKTEGQVL